MKGFDTPVIGHRIRSSVKKHHAQKRVHSRINRRVKREREMLRFRRRRRLPPLQIPFIKDTDRFVSRIPRTRARVCKGDLPIDIDLLRRLIPCGNKHRRDTGNPIGMRSQFSTLAGRKKMYTNSVNTIQLR